ncbi:hypothetical protein O6H91_20G046300 [Diphasiastrum complanatum]|uniref:Uncharacterized protein n=2 Tax=Diphasiastrum complanatum TaxID=34168 RepID=A0ACC2AQ54_DIPCM|nr:hypothetical protein O6H91_20G046300 [Diphasiastrum complanatum]KAJ7519616.1 hypothetical protein O6H91_20G046300 [Diphasiastrum complanatum]
MAMAMAIACCSGLRCATSFTASCSRSSNNASASASVLVEQPKAVVSYSRGCSHKSSVVCYANPEPSAYSRLTTAYDPDRFRFGVFSSEEVPDDAYAWKWPFRQRVWDALEEEDIAREPRPVHHRTPLFAGADVAAEKVASLPEFQAARVVKVNPDTAQRHVRLFTLKGGKKLVTTHPRLRIAFFSVVEPTTLNPKLYAEASTMAGVTKYGKTIGLKATFKVDVLVLGSVAVDPATGARLGKGEGFAEMEYAVLRHMGAVDDSTLIVTTVHDKQLVNDIPVEKLTIHDIPVDIICTPTQIIRTNTTLPRLQGMHWDKISPQRLSQIRILQELKYRVERETGEQLPVGPDEPMPLLPDRRVFDPFSRSLTTARSKGLIIWSFDEFLTEEELLQHLDSVGVIPVRVEVFPEKGPVPAMARAYLAGGEDLQRVVSLIDRSEIRGQSIRCQPDKASEPPTPKRRRH